jgi:hypothetical protein
VANRSIQNVQAELHELVDALPGLRAALHAAVPGDESVAAYRAYVAAQSRLTEVFGEFLQLVSPLAPK